MEDFIGTGTFLPEEVSNVWQAPNHYKQRSGTDWAIMQMEFFAEDVHITVIPNFSLPSAERSTLSCLTVCG